MKDEKKKTTLTRQIDNGEAASRTLLELEGAFNALEKDCYQTFSESEIHDDDGRKTCRIYLRVMQDVKQRFITAVRHGDAAQKELIRINKPHLKEIKNG